MTEHQGTSVPENVPRGHDGTSNDGHEDGHPVGTFVLMVVFLLVIIGTWGYVYLMLIGRS